MHPLLIHAVNDARRVTFHLSSDPQMGPRWTAVQVCAPHIPKCCQPFARLTTNLTIAARYPCLLQPSRPLVALAAQGARQGPPPRAALHARALVDYADC